MDFIELQRRFAAHLRDPDNVPPPPGIEPRRMDVYRELFFNNVASLLGGTFPVCRDILGEAGWRALVRRYYAGHRANTPYFLELPSEFLRWLGEAGAADPALPPFVTELAHYEWVELALSVSDAEPDLAEVDPAGDLLAGRPVVSPLAWPLAYRWPVHRLSPAYRPEAPGDLPTFLVVYRDPAGDVRFLEADAATARLLELMDTHPCEPGAATLARVAAELGDGAAAARGAQMLEGLRARGILLGTRR
ncbi:MAG: putative DNA-binding domain-containing protein [Steroidobacteraceae bacterium]|jgi:hypothetical protein|nr:putative DNA-binding domain-containing protein [Steroidobacteraceae bacterium]